MSRTVKALACILILITACQERKETGETSGAKLEVQYARGFEIFKTDYGYRLELKRPFPGAETSLVYRLTEDQDLQAEVRTISIPVGSIVCTSTTHIPMLDYLNAGDKLVGFPNTDYISTPSVRKRIDEGDVKELGSVLDMNMESLLEINPDLIMNYSMDDLKKTDRLVSMGFDVLINSDYLEEHPLGRAEWIKVFGLLFGEYQKADSIFRKIEETYLDYASKAEHSDSPCVFSGSLYGDTWFMPGGNNYAATLLKNAGFQYAVSDSSNGFLQWGYENVYEAARDCEFWLSPAPFSSLGSLGDADTRYRNFKAYREGRVYVYDNKIGPAGGNEYLELGYLRPDIILKDLLFIRDSSLIPGHELYFYRKLE